MYVIHLFPHWFLRSFLMLYFFLGCWVGTTAICLSISQDQRRNRREKRLSSIAAWHNNGVTFDSSNPQLRTRRYLSCRTMRNIQQIESMEAFGWSVKLRCFYVRLGGFKESVYDVVQIFWSKFLATRCFCKKILILNFPYQNRFKEQNFIIW